MNRPAETSPVHESGWAVTWPRLLAALLLGTVFFEGRGYSFPLLGMRIRSVQVAEVLILVLLIALSWMGKWRWRRSPLDYWLLAYLAINLAAVANSTWRARSLKIFLLLVSLVLLFWLVYQLLRTAGETWFAFCVFLAMGTLQVLFGLYQVLAGALNHYRGWSLPIGHMGVVHREYINSVWGRPYGTQVEPDFYGAICMVFALIFIILAFSINGKASKWFRIGAVCSWLGMYFSFVRASWFVFLLILLVLPFFSKKLPFFRFNWKPAMLIVVSSVGIHFLAVHSIPTFKDIHQFRFSTNGPLPAAAGQPRPAVRPEVRRELLPVRPQAAPERNGRQRQAGFQNAAAAIAAEKRADAAPGPGKTPGHAPRAPLGNSRQGLNSQLNSRNTSLQRLNSQLNSRNTSLQRLNSQLNSRNIRLLTMRVSLRTWSEHPVIGHGPGSFAYVFWRYVYGDAIARQRIADGYLPWTNPSMFFSILGDTGLLGIFIFLATATTFILLCRAKLAGPPSLLAAPAFALAIGLVALFLSYLLTNGLWLPMTWVFLALAVASLRQFSAGGDTVADAREG